MTSQDNSSENTHHQKSKFEPASSHNLPEAIHGMPEEQKQEIVKAFFCRAVVDTNTIDDIHLKAVYLEINWFLQILWHRYKAYNSKQDFENFLGEEDFNQHIISFPDIPTDSHYGSWLAQHQLTKKKPERLLMATLLALSLNDAFFFPLIDLTQKPIITGFVGGKPIDDERRFLPSIQTIIYLLGGVDTAQHGTYQQILKNNDTLFDDWGIELNTLHGQLTGRRLITGDWKNLLISLKPNIWQYFLGGEMPRPEDNQDLPIEKLETSMNYEDLVLKPETRHELKELVSVARVGKEYFADASSSSGFRKGFIALLHGEPGTGKTLIATTIGKYTNRVTYQLKMSEVVSKYIGETSQNINKVFDELQRTIEWLQGEPSILFIDEADAILGKRSEVTDSKDRYANLDVSNLLQRVEKFPGLIILATNFQQNIDPAFHRRINVQIHVPPPDEDERFELWKRYLPTKYSFETDNFARVMADKFALTGAQINNIMKRATLMAHDNKATVLDFGEYLEQPLKSELMKAGKVYTRPRDLMSLAQIDEQIYQQELLWDRALPPRWQYIPTFLPRALSQAVNLSEEDIKDVVKKVKRRWEGGSYNHLPWNEGIEVVLRDLCAVRNLDWNSIQAKVYELLDEDKKQKTATDEIDLNNEQERAGKTIQLVDMSKLKNAAEKRQEEEAKKEAQAKLSKKERLLKLENAPQSLGKVMGKKEAEAYWKEIIPEEYTYATKSTPKNLADFYGLSKEAIQWIMKTAIENADAEGATELTGGGFINPAITEMEKALGMDSLMRREHLERERKRKEAFERKKKVVPSWKDAPVYWAEAPPKDYRYARGDTAPYLGQFLPGFSFGQMLTVIAKAAEYAQKDGTNLISYTPHILPALEELGIQPPTL